MDISNAFDESRCHSNRSDQSDKNQNNHPVRDKWGELELCLAQDGANIREFVNCQLRLKLRDGQFENLRRLAAEMIYTAHTQEPGTFHYQWLLNESDQTLVINKDCANLGALKRHLSRFKKNFSVRFFNCVELTGFSVAGEPDDLAEKAFADSGAKYLRDFGGFSRSMRLASC